MIYKKFEDVLKLLANGAVGILPTDTIYGLSCTALNKDAVERIYMLKGRDYDKPLIVLLAGIEQAKDLGLNVRDLELARKYWPAPLTVVVPKGETTPEFLRRGSRTLAVRVPNVPALRNLIWQTGPLVSTSANPQGLPPARNVAEARQYFGDKLDFYLNSGELNGRPSTLAEIMSGKLKILRQGSFKLAREL